MKINNLLTFTFCFVSGFFSEIYGRDDKLETEGSNFHRVTG